MANGSPQVRRDDLHETDSAGFDWEEIDHPVTPSDREHLIAPPKPAVQEHKPLCGYLHKLTFKGPIRTWRTRWFMFDEQACCLYYYNERSDAMPAGKIEISSATLTYDMENLSKHQFEITSDGRVVSLQASSQDAMLYWLTTLQQKRRKFSSKRKKTLTDNAPEQSAVAGGLCGEEGGTAEPEDPSNAPHNSVPLVAPSDLEDRSAFTSSGSRPVFSRLSRFTNSILKPGAGGVARSANMASSPNAQRKIATEIPVISENEPISESTPQEGSPRHRENSPAVHTLGADGQMSYRQHKPSRNLANRLSLNFRRTSSGPCPRCQELQDNLDSVKIDLQIKEREVKDRDEINEFLRNEIRMSDMREKVTKELSAEGQGSGNNDKKVDILIQREQTIEQLQKLLEDAITEKDRVTTELDAKRCEVQSMGEQVSLLKEALTAKDQVVVDLTNQVFSLENKGQVPNNPLEVMLPPSTQSLESQITRLKEAVEAYKTQNQFLSSEIVELNALRVEDLETYRALSNKYHEVEAQFFKAQSKYMVLLQEAQNPRMGVGSGPDQDMVSQMLEEALGSDEQSVNKEQSNSYDQYGFSEAHVTADKESIANPLKIKAKKFDQRAQQALSDTDASHRVRWENFMARHGGGRELTRSTELKQLIRSGIPRNYRTRVWRWLTNYIVGKTYDEGQYEAILKQYAGQTSIAVNQIELDLLRTLPTNKYYDKPDAQGIDKLRRVLVAFSWYDQNVGYCQGLNRLAAIALLFLEEADAFWCIVAIVHHILPGDYYSKTLLGSQTDQRVLKDLLRDKSPKLSEHLGLCDIDFSLITFNWFHTVFVDNLPVDTMLRIWDTFLYEGSKVLFRFAIAIFKYNEEAILATENSIGIFNKLRTMCQEATDVNRLVQIGFHEINPFPKRRIEHMRSQYRLQIKAELEALDNLRSQGPITIATPTSTRDPPTADLLGANDTGPEPSYKELLAEEDSDNEEETIFLT